jgi:hypothetical protein
VTEDPTARHPQRPHGQHLHARKAALIGGLALATLGTCSVLSPLTTHAEAAHITPHPYQISLPGARVRWTGALRTSNGVRSYSYDLRAQIWAGFYNVADGLRSREAALALSTGQFRAARTALRQSVGSVHLASAQRAAVWSVQDANGTGCYVTSGALGRRSVFYLFTAAHTCTTARAAATRVFGAIARRVGRHDPAGIPWPAPSGAPTPVPTATAPPTATPTPVPTATATATPTATLPATPTLVPTATAKATPVPTATATATAATATATVHASVLVQMSGDQNAASQTFYAAGTFTVSWNAAVEDTTYISSGYFSVELYSAQDNTILEIIGTSTNGGSANYLVHDDCSRGCYLKIYSSNMTYNVTAQ